MRWFVIFLVAPILAGCGMVVAARNQANFKEEQEHTQAYAADCRQSIPAKQRVQLAKCFNDAERGLAPFWGQPDLVALRWATRVSIAEKVEKGHLSDTDADLEWAKFNAQNGGEAQYRQNASASVAAQQTAASAAYRNSLGTTCTRYGNSVSCY